MIKKNNNIQASTKKDINRIEKFLIDGFKNVRKEFKNLRSEILRVEARVENLEEGQKRLEIKADNLEIKLDGFVGKVDNLVKDNEVGAGQYREHDLKIKDHESRITTLESPTQ